MEDKINKSISVVIDMLKIRNYSNINSINDDNTYITGNKIDENIVVYYIKNKSELSSKKNIESLLSKQKLIDSKSSDNLKLIYVLCFLDSNTIPQKYLDLENDNLQVFHINNLQFNIMNHKLMPDFIKLSKSEIDDLSNTWNLQDLAKIKITDPVCKYFDMKKDDVFKITRVSNNSHKYITYRIVI